MWHIHKYPDWEDTIELKIFNPDRNTGRPIHRYQCQERRCTACNKLQARRVEL